MSDDDSSATSSHGSEQDVKILDKLHRDYRTLKRERRRRQLYNTHCQEVIRKQRHEIDKLQKRQHDIQQSLVASENVQDSEHTQRLRLLLEMDEIDEAFDREKQCQAELDKEISKLLRILKKKAHTSDKQKSQAGVTQRGIRTLDYRLEVALSYFGDQMTKNSHLRDELDILRKERLHFQEFYHRLDKELQEVRKEVMDMIGLTNGMYDARVEAQRKMSGLKAKVVRDLARHGAEVKEQAQVLALQQRLTAFNTTKCHERISPDAEEQKWIDGGGEAADSLEEVFMRIKAVTGEYNMGLDMVVARFIQGEELNAALTRMIAEQVAKIGRMREHILQVQEEMRQIRTDDLEQERLHLAMMRDTEDNQKQLDVKIQETVLLLNNTNSIMEQIQALVDGILNNIAVSERKAIEDKLNSAGITEDNILNFLELVEQKTSDLLIWQASFKPIIKDTEDEAEFTDAENWKDGC